VDGVVGPNTKNALYATGGGTAPATGSLATVLSAARAEKGGEQRCTHHAELQSNETYRSLSLAGQSSSECVKRGHVGVSCSQSHTCGVAAIRRPPARAPVRPLQPLNHLLHL
jgi:hypothetical protein